MRVRVRVAVSRVRVRVRVAARVWGHSETQQLLFFPRFIVKIAKRLNHELVLTHPLVLLFRV